MIELLVVVAIVGVLSSVIVVLVQSAREKARISGALSFAAHLDRVLGDQMGGWDFNECAGVTSSNLIGGYSTATVPSGSWSNDTPANKPGCSIALNGSQHIVIPHSGLLNPRLGSGTWAFWFKVSSGGTSRTVFRKSDGANSSGVIIDLDPSGILSCRVHTNGVLAVYASGSYDDNKWHFLTCVLDRSSQTLSVYIDGNLRGTNSAAVLNGVDLNAGAPVYVGSNGYAGWFIGNIDNIRMYANALQ